LNLQLGTWNSSLVTEVFDMPMRIGTEMPALEGATEWFNATGAAAEVEAKGHPTLVHFWSLSCGMCKENLPRVAQWRDERAADGLRVVAVHMPRYEADTDAEAVREAVATYNITEPCAVDNGTACATPSRTSRDTCPPTTSSTPRASSEASRPASTD
jgi:thiol-disulfide isomerase/thioredoxin